MASAYRSTKRVHPLRYLTSSVTFEWRHHSRCWKAQYSIIIKSLSIVCVKLSLSSPTASLQSAAVVMAHFSEGSARYAAAFQNLAHTMPKRGIHSVPLSISSTNRPPLSMKRNIKVPSWAHTRGGGQPTNLTVGGEGNSDPIGESDRESQPRCVRGRVSQLFWC